MQPNDSVSLPDDLISRYTALKIAGAYADKFDAWIASGTLKTYTYIGDGGVKKFNYVSRSDVRALVADLNAERTPDKPTPRPQTAQREASGGSGIDPADLGFDLNEAIGATDATKFLRGKRGRAPHRETIRRWMLVGCVVGGERVILRSVVWSGERLTMKSWIEDFIRRRTQLGFRLGGAVPRGVRELRNAVERARLEIEQKPKSKE